jgi:hypothetical protein
MECPMMSEECVRSEVLLESIQTHVKVIAEGHIALVERLDRIETKVDVLTTRVDRLEVLAIDAQRRLTGLEVFAVDAQRRLTGLEVFAVDTKRRLTRIESHLHLNGGSARHAVKKAVPPKRGRKS